jgi:heme/copper-type cytochrome/quinol oxidase subunit 1
MTTIDTHPDGAAVSGDSSTVSSAGSVGSFAVGVAAWVTTTDHKKIGRIYVGIGLVVLLATTVVGLLLGLERADDSTEILRSDALLQLFQVYRVGLVFGAILPVGLGLAIAVTPLQLGARSIAFPRLALTGCYAWLGGISLTMIALGRNGGMGGGDPDMVDLYLSGIGLMVLGLLASAGAVAATVLTTRAPGMTMRRVPFFAWSTLIGTLGMLLVLPVAFGLIIYMFIDHRLGIGANFGPVEDMAAWLGWMFSVPAVIVYALPGVGMFAEMVPVAFKRRQAMRGTMFAAVALVGVAAFSAATQQFAHDVLFDTDGETFFRGLVPFLILSGLPLLGVTLVVLLALGTVKQGASKGAPSIRSPFVFALFGLLAIGAGIAANALQGITDLELIDPGSYTVTTFEEGATLLVVYGTVLAVLGGLVFWAPKLWGRVVGDAKAVPLALLGMAGTLLAAVPLLVAGFLDQVGGIPSSDVDVAAMLATEQVEGGGVWSLLSTIGHGVMGLTVLAMIGLMIATFTGDGDDAHADVNVNPYGGHTIEWSATSPAPTRNFEHVATISSAEPLLDRAAATTAAESQGDPS